MIDNYQLAFEKVVSAAHAAVDYAGVANEIDPHELIDKAANEFAAQLTRLRVIAQAAEFHPRATKLMLKEKNFIVIAEDEPYFSKAYAMIRVYELAKGTWTEEDERLYLYALAAALKEP
jgi:hypothetical protein